MSFLLSKLNELEESEVDELYKEQLSTGEKLELEKALGCSIVQLKSKVEGWVTFFEKGDFKIGLGIGVLVNRRKNTVKKIPYVAVGYNPKLIQTKTPAEFTGSLELLENYLQGLSENSEETLSVPLRILEEARKATEAGKKFDWNSFPSRTYEITPDLSVRPNISDSGFSLIAYSPKEKRKYGIEILTNAAKLFEEHFKITPS